MQAGTSQAVSYVIIPLELGEVEIEVTALVLGTTVADGVRKKLRVVVSSSYSPFIDQRLQLLSKWWVRTPLQGHNFISGGQLSTTVL